jgi:hypothetical protein
MKDFTRFTWFIRESGWQGEYTPVSELTEEQAKHALCECIEAIEIFRNTAEVFDTVMDGVLCEKVKR